jgi:NAD-dependent dihydropyrimidine dehydrogenase PreA subunit
MIREVVSIDEALCDGCGLCIPSCHEGALRIVDGKARLVSDRMCDGLGACLGHCPRGAIKVEKREAEAFDEAALPISRAPAPARTPHAGGCPGSRYVQFKSPAARTQPAGPAQDQPSALTHWPVQLRLLSPHAPALQGAALLVAADCVPVACADFHAKLLAGRAVVIGCPKFDDLPAYVAKLTEMLRGNDLREVVVARMEVPCCGGILQAVLEARRQANSAVPVTDVVISVQGEVLRRQTVDLAPAAVSAC